MTSIFPAAGLLAAWVAVAGEGDPLTAGDALPDCAIHLGIVPVTRAIDDRTGSREVALEVLTPQQRWFRCGSDRQKQRHSTMDFALYVPGHRMQNLKS